MLAPDRLPTDPTAILAVAASLAAPLVSAPWVVAVSTSIALLWLSRTSGYRILLLAVMLLVYQSARVNERLHGAEQRYHQSRFALSSPKRCVLEGTVVRSPIVFARGTEKTPEALGQARVDLAAPRLDCEGEPLTIEGLVRIYGAPERWNRGDRVAIVADLATRSFLRNPGSGDARTRLALDNIVASGQAVDAERLSKGHQLGTLIDRARYFVRQRIIATYPNVTAPFARALVLGETDLRDEETTAFRRSGLAHLLAVSGTHLVIAVIALGRALQALLVRIPYLAGRMDVGRISAVFCLLGSWLYADFAGGSGSAWRAAAMVSVAMLTRSLGRRPNALRCFSLSLLGANLVEPLAIYDASFALSLTATAGLAFSARIQVSRIWRPLLATTAAMLACAPVLLYLAPELPLVSVAANLLAAPIGEMAALPLCLLHTVSWCFPALESGLALLASGALWVVRAIAHGASETGASLPLPPPTASQLAVLALTALFLHGARRRCRKPVLLVATLALLLAEWCAIKQGSPRGALRITVLDVGQGDAILIDLPDGTLMLLDAGPGETLGGHGGRVVRAALRKRRRSRIDILALSHPHPDHYGGMADVSAVVPIGAYWSPQIVRPDRRGRPLQKWLDSLRQGETRWMGPRQLCGQNHHFGEAVVEVLAPCPDVTGHAKVNDNSLIIRIRFGAHAALLMGDAEAEQEQRLLATKRQLRSDFLKVGHHGSRTSTNPALLAVIKPHHAAISCGVRNRFGHPHPQTLRTLSQIDTWRTDDHGATIWQSDGQTVTSGPAR